MDWTRGHAIGRGTSATVSIATSRSYPNDIFAVKSVELSRSECLLRECKLLSTLNCPHIVGYRGYTITKEKGTAMFNLMMEYAPHGTVANEIRRRGGGLHEGMIAYLTRQIVQGLEYLHSRGIVHCDIKGSNILLTRVGPKIADFGCAKAADEPVIGVTPIFMAPEVARAEEQGYPADIWALGCMIIEMSTGRPPWPNAPSTWDRIGCSGKSPELPIFLSDQAKDFLNKCLRVDPRERWTAEQLLKHPFVDELRVPHGKQVQELLNIPSEIHTCSPTSVLDQGIWSSVEEGYHSEAGSDAESPDSPMERMQQLAMDSGKVGWGFGDGWITVRDVNYHKINILDDNVSFEIVVGDCNL